VTDEIGTVKLFNKWSYEDVEVRDISLTWVKLKPTISFW
jgi:small subunit ribosomal protein S5e